MSEVRKPSPKLLDATYDKVKRSKKHELRIATSVGGRRLPASGGRPWSARWDPTTACGDVTTKKLHIEHKMTDRGSIGVKQEWLDKVSDGARRVGKDPAMVLTYEARGRSASDWLLIPLDVAKRYFPELFS